MIENNELGSKAASVKPKRIFTYKFWYDLGTLR